MVPKSTKSSTENIKKIGFTCIKIREKKRDKNRKAEVIYCYASNYCIGSIALGAYIAIKLLLGALFPWQRNQESRSLEGLLAWELKRLLMNGWPNKMIAADRRSLPPLCSRLYPMIIQQTLFSIYSVFFIFKKEY